MTTVQIVVDTRDVQASLMRMDSALSAVGLASFLTGTVAPYIQERAVNRFTQEGDDVSGKWAALQPSTQEFRSRIPGVGPTGPINRRTGQLERYITQSGSDTAPVGTTGAQLTFPGDAPEDTALMQKMETAQRGRAQPRTVPRPVLGLNEKDLAFTTQALMFYFHKAVGP